MPEAKPPKPLVTSHSRDSAEGSVQQTARPKRSSSLMTIASSESSSARGLERVVLAGGCFWGVEAVFAALKGVHHAVSGYTGGSERTANYEAVCTGATGHAEAVEVTYDPATLSFHRLLEVYFLVAHDPTQRNRQGPDIGPQYRSGIFFTTDEQKRITEEYIRQLDREGRFRAPIVTTVEPLAIFHPAEAYHQQFVERNPNHPYVCQSDKPKLARLRELFPDLISANGSG